MTDKGEIPKAILAVGERLNWVILWLFVIAMCSIVELLIK